MPGFAPDYRDGALTVAHVGDEPPEDVQLVDSAEQPGRRMHPSPTPLPPKRRTRARPELPLAPAEPALAEPALARGHDL